MAWSGTSTTSSESLETRIGELGRSLLTGARRMEQRGGLSEKLIDWATKDPAFKTQLFRFVDVFPVLQHDPAAVHEHLRQYLDQPGVTLPPGLGSGLKAGGLFKQTLSRAITSQVLAMANRFIAGETAEAALPKLRRRWQEGIGFSIDLLGEACLSDSEAQAYQQRYLQAIDQLANEVANWPKQPHLQSNHVGSIPTANVSIKISSLVTKADAADQPGSIERLVEALGPILKKAQQKQVLINFDMEHYALKDLTLALFMRCCDQFDFPAGLAMQAYLRSGDEDARRICQWARSKGRAVTVRLVKGAYWDYENILAEERGWPVPVWSHKRESDACFERMARQFIETSPRSANEGGTVLALGSHNVRSIATGLALAEAHDLPESAIELQMLYGMAEGLKRASAKRGLRVREYVPVGEMIPGMAYLVRRLLENSSNESWLRAGFNEANDPATLLASPHELSPGSRSARTSPGKKHDGRHGQSESDGQPASNMPQAERHALSPAVKGVGNGRPFFNEPHRDFSQKTQREAFQHAIDRTTLPRVANAGTVEQAKDAIAQASDFFRKWRDWDPVDRANLIVKAAELMRQKRDELSALVIREAGKTWRDADGDVCEAIDFCEFYARQSVGLFIPKRLGQFVGELDEQWHLPRGVAAVISPWNFPLAICAGMTSAALVTGNATIVKPAEQTPAIARAMVDCFWQAGVPREALHFLPGEGERVGAALVRDHRVALIAFTGSKAVGLDIVKTAGETDPDQQQVKKVVCEMGGKNAIIVDDSADPDEAVQAVRHSAFEYAGQRCSACSRVIVLPGMYDRFVNRLIEATQSMQIGDPLAPGTDMGHVIDQQAADKIHRYIEIAKEEGELALAMQPPIEQVRGRPIVGPHIVTGIDPHHRVAQEEIFGPVLSVMRAPDFETAVHIANGSNYRLTGGVFSRTPSHLDYARRHFRVGNLYLNRGIIGSLVGRQPFGGFGLSGVGAKAGGDEYLLQFVVPRACTENTMRRGFAPGLSS
jgi:RHH-type proline utilization regulon transcriptional repressor/proline dehydrogenase/delta 1-pyrroline-5-carboxylate dehydrogenase